MFFGLFKKKEEEIKESPRLETVKKISSNDLYKMYAGIDKKDVKTTLLTDKNK